MSSFKSSPSVLLSFSIPLEGSEKSIKIVSKDVLYLGERGEERKAHKNQNTYRSTGVLRSVCSFIHDTVQRTSAGSLAQPEHKVPFSSSFHSDECQPGITNRIKLK